MENFKTKAGTTLPLLDLRGKKYLQVAYRVVWAREEHPDWSFKAEMVASGPDWALFKATIQDHAGVIIATAHKKEDKAGFADYIEKAETGSIGRALALAGYGTQFTDDLDEGDRIADAPLKNEYTASVTPIRKPSPSQLNLLNVRAEIYNIPKETLKKWAKERYGVSSSTELTMQQFDALLGDLEKGEVK